MKQFFIDAVFGMIIGLKFVSITYFLYLGMRYIGERADANDMNHKAWHLLFVPVIMCFVGYDDLVRLYDLPALPATEKTFMIVFSIAGLIALCIMALKDYNRITRQ